MPQCPAIASSARPDFLPADLDYESLPEHIRQALVFVVEPLYEELVVGARSIAERSAGSALVLLTTLEVFQQFELAQATDFTTLAVEPEEQRLAREKLVRAHLRLVHQKLRVAGLVFRLQRLREQDRVPILTPLDRLLARVPGKNIFSRNGESDNQPCQPGEDQPCQAGADPPCPRQQQCARTAGSCSADSRRHSRELRGQTEPWAAQQPSAAVSRRRARRFPREKKFLRIRDSADQNRQPRAGPQLARSVADAVRCVPHGPQIGPRTALTAAGCQVQECPTYVDWPVDDLQRYAQECSTLPGLLCGY